MNDPQEPMNLEQVLQRLDEAARNRERVAIGDILEAVGSRSFGPLLVVVGIIAMSPLSGIPGMPSTVAVIVITVAVQLLFHKKHFRLPRWVIERSVSHGKLLEAVRLVQRPARIIDRLLKPRLTGLTGRRGAYGIAMICVVSRLLCRRSSCCRSRPRWRTWHSQRSGSRSSPGTVCSAYSQWR